MSDYNGDGATPRFTVGSVLGQSFQVFSKHPVLFLGVIFMFFVFLMIVSFLTSEIPFVSLVMPFITTPISMIAQGCIGYAVFQTLTGQRVSAGKSASYAASRVFQLLALSFASSILICLGMILLIVPGVILFCMWAVVVPVCVVERLGVMASFSRSASLTKGHRLQILGIFLISIVAVFAVLFVALLLIGALLAPYHLLLAGIIFLAITFPISFFNVMTAVTYYRLRAAKEGVAMESLSVVFD